MNNFILKQIVLDHFHEKVIIILFQEHNNRFHDENFKL